jgi:hypothetical protein
MNRQSFLAFTHPMVEILHSAVQSFTQPVYLEVFVRILSFDKSLFDSLCQVNDCGAYLHACACFHPSRTFRDSGLTGI